MLSSVRRAVRMPLRARIDPRMLPNYSTAAASEASATNPNDNEVLFATKGAARIVTLNRPKKLNAINSVMCDLLLPRLLEYEKSDLTGSIIVKGAGGKAFSAGGDVAELAIRARDEGFEKAGDVNAKYFRQEFSVDQLVATYQKPYISFWDGFVMGGGVGLSSHGSFRIATEKTAIAMPETTIGYYPDVGGLFFLSKLNGKIGLFSALTSHRIKGYDAYRLGFATHYVNSEQLPRVENRLSELEAGAIELDEYYRMVDAAIEEFAAEPPADYKPEFGPKELDLIDEAFSSPTVEEIIETLKAKAEVSPKFAADTIKVLEQRCPVSLKVTLEAYKRLSVLDIAAAFQQEMIICHNFCFDPNFREGVLALLVEKRPPKWEPATLAEVSQERVDKFFEARHTHDPIKFVNDRTFKSYPHRFGLPSEQDLMDFVTGETSEQETKASRADVIEHFKSIYPGGVKSGLTEYLNELLDRRTTPDPNDPTLLDWNY